MVFRSIERRTSSVTTVEAVYSIIASVFFFVRLFVGRFGRAVGQTHSLTSFGLSGGLRGLAMCVAVKRGLYVVLFLSLRHFLII